MTPEQPEEAQDKNIEPERPLECSECKKPIAVCYTEIIGKSVTNISMCADCPELQKKLHGLSYTEQAERTGGTNLACGECGTTLESLRVGNYMGCSNCYEVFGDIVMFELHEMEKIPHRIAKNKKSTPIHIGRAPGEVQEINPSLRLLALNEELKETLIREDYEQAAWLRDQIRALTDNNQETKKEGVDEQRE